MICDDLLLEKREERYRGADIVGYYLTSETLEANRLCRGFLEALSKRERLSFDGKDFLEGKREKQRDMLVFPSWMDDRYDGKTTYRDIISNFAKQHMWEDVIEQKQDKAYVIAVNFPDCPLWQDEREAYRKLYQSILPIGTVAKVAAVSLSEAIVAEERRRKGALSGCHAVWQLDKSWMEISIRDEDNRLVKNYMLSFGTRELEKDDAPFTYRHCNYHHGTPAIWEERSYASVHEALLDFLRGIKEDCSAGIKRVFMVCDGKFFDKMFESLRASGLIKDADNVKRETSPSGCMVGLVWEHLRQTFEGSMPLRTQGKEKPQAAKLGAYDL